MKAWLTKTCDGKFAIEKMEMPHSLERVDMRKPPAGVGHTIQGSLESGIGVFKQHYAPTFGVGPHRIVQFVPLGMIDAALENHYGGGETNRWARVQIEVAGYSKQTPYSFDAATSDALASLLATCRVECGIPLTRPYPDAMPPGGSNVWARESFPRRHDGHWGKTTGWYGHVEIPENSHWDPGALRWSLLLVEAKKRIPLKAKLRPYYAVRVLQGRLRRA